MISKILLILLLSCCSSLCFSQINSFGVFAGPQTTTASYKVRDIKQETENKYGLQAGVTWKIPFENKLYFAPAFYYTMKGYKVALKDSAYPPGADAISNDVTVHAIEIAPLFNIDLSPDPGHFFIKFGPAIDVIFKGREKVGLKTGNTVNRDMKFTFGDYGRITSAAIVHFGYQHENGFFIFGHYAHGLGSMNNADFGPAIRHRVAGVSLAKYLRRGKEN